MRLYGNCAPASALITSLLLPISSTAADTPETATSPVQEQEVIRIQGQASRGYQGMNLEGSLKLPADPLEVPQSAVILNRELLDDIGAVRLDDALDFSSGIARQNSFGNLWDNFSIRGFTANESSGPVYLRDGVRANRGFTGRKDAVNVERIEVLKGSPSALYGRSDAGGTLNLVLKKAEFEPETTLSFSASNKAASRLTMDATGALTDSLAGRLNLSVEKGETFREHVDENNYMLAPALTWNISDQTRLYYDGELARQKRPLDRGVIAVDGQLDVVPIDRFLGEPDNGDIRLRTLNNRIRLEHQLKPDWQARFVLSHTASSLKGHNSSPFGSTLEAPQQQFSLAPNWLVRERRYRDYSSDDWVGVAELSGQFSTGKIEHSVLAGMEAAHFRQEMEVQRSNPGSGNLTDLYLIDYINPIHGASPTPAYVPGRMLYRRDTEASAALYIQDMLHLTPNLRVLLGGRLDRIKQTSHNLVSDNKQKQTHTGFSPRLGISYSLTPASSLYANVSRSFDTNSGLDRQGNSFDPQEATSFDLGLKSLWLEDRLSIDTGLFIINKKNVLTTDPVDSAYSIAAGEVESQGFELDIAGLINDQWKLGVSYTYTDANILADGTRYLEDTPVINVPRHSASLLTSYDFHLKNGYRAGLGGAVVYVDERPGYQADTRFKLPSYTTVQVNGYIQPHPDLRLSLQVHNLFDETHYLSSYWPTWVMPGAPRTLTAQVSYSF